jgi:D-alanyl-D-alanine carboxypeptidase
MKRLVCLFLFIFCCFTNARAQKLVAMLDSLLGAQSETPFNGVILVSENGKIKYNKTFGYTDLSHKKKIKHDDKFVIGSISKQFTALLILQQYEKGRLQLSDPITKFLNNVPADWDNITIHHLLTHTHGIVNFEKPLAFTPGTRFMYSQHGYALLGQIIEKVTGTSFPENSRALFQKIGMKNTFHPSFIKDTDIVTCFTSQADGSLKVETKSLQGFPAAGGFISTASDLRKWNEHLFDAKLLNDSTLKLMTSPKAGALRQHPVFGNTVYGYGITVDTTSGLTQWGQTGFADGFASMDFYFPESNTSVVVLQNVVYYPDDLKKTYYYHTRVLDLVKKSIGKK